jgi:hypothetical protein
MSTPNADSVTITNEPPRRGQLRRADKVMTPAQLAGFLEGAFCGRTATVGADGYPYVVRRLKAIF